jgi:hypothetical protein
MTCISSLRVRNGGDTLAKTARAAIFVCIACSVSCGEQMAQSTLALGPQTYGISYDVRPNPAKKTVEVTLTLNQSSSLLLEMTMRTDSRTSGFKADGALDVRADAVSWRPPANGGAISWQVSVPHRRNENGYDAWLDTQWGLFRAEDIIPRVSTRTRKGATSETQMRFAIPSGWSVVTQYYGENNQFTIDNPARRFDQPNGWIVMGDLGVRRENIAGVRVAIAGPVDNDVRRMDTLALLRWTLPEVSRLFPDMPARLTIVSAGNPMWRGGLSAPQSMFVHSSRPLISENATSTLLHEVMHLLLRLSADDGYDWIVEGLAEFYSLEILHRSGTISDERFAVARADTAEWASSATDLCLPVSSGAATALAVTLFDALNVEIKEKTDGVASLDDVARALRHADKDVDLAMLIDIVEQLAGDKPDTLHIDKLPGCHNIAPVNRNT